MRVERCLVRQMLAAAKANFEPGLAIWGKLWRRNIDPQPRQQARHQLLMLRPQGMALAAAIELMATVRRLHFTAALSALARSVFSHEKPPSASAARPKWP